MAGCRPRLIHKAKQAKEKQVRQSHEKEKQCFMNPNLIHTYLLIAFTSAAIAALVGLIHVLVIVIVLVVSGSKKNEPRENERF